MQDRDQQREALKESLRLLGDRWSLLIVSEVMVAGPRRYTDLIQATGIASNLLVRRLARLESAGIIDRVPPLPPLATSVFRLTKRGESLKPVLDALSGWNGAASGSATALVSDTATPDCHEGECLIGQGS